MSRRSFEIVVTSTAPPARVFALISDEAGWSSWARPLIPASRWELPGGVAPAAVGSIRLQGRRAPFMMREAVVENDPPHHHAYRIISGLPVRDYLATIDLTPTDGGTRIAWRAEFEPFPGLGLPVLALARSVVTSLARRLARAAATRP